MSADLSRRVVLLGGGAAMAAASIPFVASRAEATTVPFPGRLQLGSRGAAVTTLQAALGGAGLWLGSYDGSFGPMTQQAVLAIQKVHGLARTGAVDETTWNSAMLRVRPTPRYPSSVGLEVDLNRQLLMVVGGGLAQMTINTSTGSGAYFYSGGRRLRAITPTGTFKIYRKSTNEGSSGWVNGTLGAMYRPRFFTTVGHAIHGSTSIPAYPASHGCCRVSVQAQDKMLSTNEVGIGRYVRIY
ncbi:L,D-transpeptidase family protein [Calidifontibacter terrae]